jgi:hypothetical protein
MKRSQLKKDLNEIVFVLWLFNVINYQRDKLAQLNQKINKALDESEDS